MNTERLVQWCEEKLTEGVDCFTLLAVGMDRNRMLDRVELLDPKVSLAPDVVERLELRAGQHANDHGGRHCFEIETTAGGEDHGLQTFTVHAELDSFTEPANAGGQQAMMMRHTEVAMRLATETALKMQDKAQKMIDRQSERIEYLEGQRLGVIQTMEEIYINKHDRDIKALKTVAGEERKNLAATKLLELAPSVASTVFGKFLPANQLDAVTAHAARDLFENLDAKQIEGMIAQLPQEKQIAMLQVMKRLAQVEETNAAAAAGVTPINKNQEGGQ